MVNFLLYAGSQCPDTFSWNVFFCCWPQYMACEISVPQPGIKPTPPALEGGVLTTGPSGPDTRSTIVLDVSVKMFVDEANT